MKFFRKVLFPDPKNPVIRYSLLMISSAKAADSR